MPSITLKTVNNSSFFHFLFLDDPLLNGSRRVLDGVDGLYYKGLYKRLFRFHEHRQLIHSISGKKPPLRVLNGTKNGRSESVISVYAFTHAQLGVEVVKNGLFE